MPSEKLPGKKEKKKKKITQYPIWRRGEKKANIGDLAAQIVSDKNDLVIA